MRVCIDFKPHAGLCMICPSVKGADVIRYLLLFSRTRGAQCLRDEPETSHEVRNVILLYKVCRWIELAVGLVPFRVRAQVCFPDRTYPVFSQRSEERPCLPKRP